MDRRRLSKEYRRNFDPEHAKQIKELLALDNQKEKVNQLIFKHQNQQFFLAKDSRKKFKARKGGVTRHAAEEEKPLGLRHAQAGEGKPEAHGHFPEASQAGGERQFVSRTSKSGAGANQRNEKEEKTKGSEGSEDK